jgi:hypothetical protein
MIPVASITANIIIYAGLDAFNGGVYMFNTLSGPYTLRSLVNYLTQTYQIENTFSDGGGFCAPNGICGLRSISMGYDRLKGLIHSFPVLVSPAYTHFESAKNLMARFNNFEMTTNSLKL